MPEFKLNVQNTEVTWSATRQGDELHLQPQEGEMGTLRLVAQDGPEMLLERVMPDGSRRRLRVVAHMEGDTRQVWVNGRLFVYERVRQRGSGAAEGEGSLSASIPAVVSKVLVAAEDQVEEGAKLILLESMKMVIPIQAPYAGRITAVHCTAGDSVPAGVPLIEIEREESP